MSIFKKLKKDEKGAKGAQLPEPEPVKQLDKRVGLESYRDFFTLKNYWKTVDRKRQDAANSMMQSFLLKFSLKPLISEGNRSPTKKTPAQSRAQAAILT
ncbi:unnamed protein product, partial [Mesorhabditis belari]|uniref:Uncharacterized protein n=1 Tax=Mesorhabditis belari TaxID=2138241 RepID=A0AAF3F1C4_9BILA